LDDTDLPAALTEGWTEDEGNEGPPFPPGPAREAIGVVVEPALA